MISSPSLPVGQTDAAMRGFGLRAWVVGGGLLVLFACLGGRFVQLQHYAYDQYADRHARMLSGRQRLAPKRGDIVDRHGKSLAISVKARSCALDPLLARESEGGLEGVLDGLAKTLDLTPRELQRLYERSGRVGCRFVWVRRHLEPARADAVAAAGLPGVILQNEYRREYPAGRLGAHLLGFTDIDGRGLEGLEKLCDPILLGLPAERHFERDGRRRVLAESAEDLTDDRRGWTAETTLDRAVQAAVESELDRIVETYTPESAVAVVMDPYTGDILALGSRPNFDPNEPTEEPVDHRLNRAVASVFEPGSTFKPFVFAAALDRGLVRVDERFHCENGAWRMACGRVLHDAHGYGGLTAAQVVVKSSNIGIAKIADRLGMDGLYRTVRLFGFGEETGSPLGGELKGLVHPLPRWTAYSMGSVPMGQEIAVTPLQLATAFCTFANGGVLMKPRLIRALRDESGRVVETFPPAPKRRVFSEKTAAVMRDILNRVVEEGTGRRARMAEYSLAGKTGTAQLPKNAAEVAATGRGGYSETRYVGSFVGFAPHDVPRLVVMVSVREPKGEGKVYYGGIVAAPAVREICKQALLYWKVPPRAVAP